MASIVDHFTKLPDELIEAIVSYLPPADSVSFGSTSRRSNKITYEPLVWRRHCLQGWKHWEAHHDLHDRLDRPIAQTKWRQLYQQRQKTDTEALDTFNKLLTTQPHRIARIEAIAKCGYDVKDLLAKQRDETPDDAEDVLARRYYATAILGQIHRETALNKWMRLQREQMVSLEEVLGAYDLFVLGDRRGDLHDINKELDRIAARVRARDPDFDALSTRRKAVQVARFVRSENLAGNTSSEEYHNLRNNFISMVLFDEPRTSLPLQSAAIYCAIARRLGVNAKPSNFPGHVHVVIERPADAELDGRPRSAGELSPEDPADVMHMDPWRTADEVPRSSLATRLSQMGAPVAQHNFHLAPTTMLNMAQRTGRNIMNSVQEARDRQRGTTRRNSFPDTDAAWYSMLWSMLVLGDSGDQAATLHRRRQCLPYLMEHYQSHFPEDLGLIEELILPMFEGEREHHVLVHLIATARLADSNAKAPSPRPTSPTTPRPAFKIGTHFQHRRYGYHAIVVGWDTKCSAETRWIEQMRVDELPRGRDQPFYNVVADDKTVRYVAEENIRDVGAQGVAPPETLMGLAGRYFKRWDRVAGRFVSNIRDEYPDD
ncbi:F-box domain protein [Teratosphaeria nubilosa]|uniref:F-box domain protein n=1 Tax=Teratosphaeria nubilosa TaxID=161662 RepID=A0A6G1L9Q7_9PEZI|nr:F-box domain protein [Teratosphaeria nubilosa]